MRTRLAPSYVEPRCCTLSCCFQNTQSAVPVPKVAVDKYLSRQLLSLTWFKKLKPLEIEYDLSFANPPIKLHAPMRPDQKAVLLAALSEQSLVVLSDLGWGKGHPVGTKIATPEGWKNIEELKIGDSVMGSTGEAVELTGVFRRGKLPAFRVWFSDKTSIVTDGDHLWTVFKNGGPQRGKRRMLSTAQIAETLKTGWAYWSIPLTGPLRFTKRKLIIPPYTMGVLLGEGHLAGGGCTFTPGDEDVPLEVQKDIGETYRLTHSNTKDRSCTYRITYPGRKKNPMLDALRNLRLAGVRSDQRYIPDEYLYGSVEDRIALLQGLLDTDGWAGNTGCHFCSSSKLLADGVASLVESLGGVVRQRIKENMFYTYKGQRFRGKPAHHVTINLPATVPPFRAHAFRYSPTYKYVPGRKIERVEPIGDRSIICLSVAAEDGLYVAERCIVTHNTSVSLELLQHYYDHGYVRRAFIFTPTDEVAEGWEDEIIKWGFTIPRVRLVGSSHDKWGQLSRFGDGLVIGTYAGIAAAVSKLVSIEGKTKQHREVVPRLILAMTDRVDAVVFDQSTKLQSTNSLSFETCRDFANAAQIRFALAGRAFGRDPTPLWSQFFLTDGGKALGRSMGMFKEAFFRRRRTQWGTKWIFRKRREPELARFISASSLRYAIEECVDLPPKVYIKKGCAFPAENWDFYDRIVEEAILAKGSYREVRNSFLRMRQISSGFVGFKDDDTGERAQIEFEYNPKLELLLELIDEVPDDRKMIVFYEFTFSGARICQELAERKIPHGWLWSGTKDWTSIKEAFNNDPDYRVLVLQWKKGGMGLNLQAANYCFFYESPVSAIERYECEGRIYRTGQTYKSIIYDVVVRDSVDERILDFHKQGRDIFSALVENPSRVLRRNKR